MKPIYIIALLLAFGCAVQQSTVPVNVAPPAPPIAKQSMAQPLVIQPPSPKGFKLTWEPSPDPNVVAYEIAASPNVGNISQYHVITNTKALTVNISNASKWQFFIAIGVDSNGINTLGNYQ